MKFAIFLLTFLTAALANSKDLNLLFCSQGTGSPIQGGGWLTKNGDLRHCVLHDGKSYFLRIQTMGPEGIYDMPKPIPLEAVHANKKEGDYLHLENKERGLSVRVKIENRDKISTQLTGDPRITGWEPVTLGKDHLLPTMPHENLERSVAE